MSGKPLQRLVDLVEFDREVVALEHSLATIESEVARHKEAIIADRSAIKEAKQRVISATKYVDECELVLKEIDESLKQKKQRFDTAANMTEYRALKTEIDLLMEEQQKIENEVATSWTDLENAQRDGEELEDRLLKEIEEHDIQVQAQDEALNTLNEQIVGKSLLRAELEKQVNEEWRDRYAMMRKSVADPVVPAINGSCSACFYLLPNQDVMRLRRGAVLTCNSCYRLLFDPTSTVHENQREEV
jgi:hypothetical protein